MEISNLTKERIRKSLKENKRFDSRGLLEFRDIKVETGVSKNAEGSARVRIGNTDIIAGVKMNVAEPYPDSQDEGVMTTTVELLPLSSPEFEPGPPKIEAIELARIIDRGIRESGFIDFKKLCIKEGEKVWMIFIDIFSLNNDGNLLDAAGIAAVAALLSAKMPKYDEKEEKVKFGELTEKGIPLTDAVPFNLTFHKVGESIILDPKKEEEESSEGRLSVAFSNGKKLFINAMQKGNEKPLSKEEVMNIIEEGTKKFKELFKKVHK